MKVTNLKTSQKLKELGFETYTEFYHIADEKCISQGSDADDYELEHIDCGHLHRLQKCFNYPAYDLETILEALPKSIEINDEEGRRLFPLRIDKDKIEYRLGTEYYSEPSGYEEDIKENESLANTAGRLLIKLLKDNIIKLGE
jgi:hypothetical protein